MRDLTEAIDNLNLVNAVNGRREAAVHTEYLMIDDDAECQEVKEVGKVVPDVGGTVFALAFSVEAVRLGHAAGFVVATDQGDATRVSKLKADKERNGFNAEEAAIDVVT